MTPLSCPSCGATLPEGTSACAYCGRRVPAGEREASSSAAMDETATPEQLVRHRHVLQLALLACGIMLALGALVALLLAMQPSEETAPRGAAHRIEYRMSGSLARTTVTYTNTTGDTEQFDTRLPWRRTYVMEDVPCVYVAALSFGETGTLTCQIYLDGVLWKESTSSGTGAMVTCGGGP